MPGIFLVPGISCQHFVPVTIPNFIPIGKAQRFRPKIARCLCAHSYWHGTRHWCLVWPAQEIAGP
ncbi:31109_t:CDS:2 [Gigaspora margarita]|uniref:31109_t:CDS:1 n=1 Tax=Gigaspora margarita TaxID=4874 RepID=A0ABN7UYY2_GIGMA|nr:31109_t:CDS:2 [Gigaspora margarita]